MNFSGSAGAMEPHGAVQIFKRSLENKIRYMNLIADGDSINRANDNNIAISAAVSLG